MNLMLICEVYPLMHSWWTGLRVKKTQILPTAEI